MTAPAAEWLKAFPVLNGIGDPAWRRAAAEARLKTVPPGGQLFREGEACRYYLFIVAGGACVRKSAPNGQFITLYHLGPGQTCELTTTCLLGGESYPAEAVAETEVHVALLPKERFQAVIGDCPQFGRFVFSTIERGVNELIALVEQVAFSHMDRRLAHWLVARGEAGDALSATHHAIADELGTAREVVSRLLKEFEHRGWVGLRRGRIDIFDRDSLMELAGQAPLSQP